MGSSQQATSLTLHKVLFPLSINILIIAVLELTVAFVSTHASMETPLCHVNLVAVPPDHQYQRWFRNETTNLRTISCVSQGSSLPRHFKRPAAGQFTPTGKVNVSTVYGRFFCSIVIQVNIGHFSWTTFTSNIPGSFKLSDIQVTNQLKDQNEQQN